MNAVGNSGPGYARNPEHRVELKPGPKRVRVIFQGETIADTEHAIRLEEANYPPVYYIPLSDIRADVLTPTAHQTYCPFKGKASYWSLDLRGEHVENAVWAYQAPYDEVMPIKGLAAFYPNRGASFQID